MYDPESDSLVAERTYGCLPSEESGLMMCKGDICEKSLKIFFKYLNIFLTSKYSFNV